MAEWRGDRRRGRSSLGKRLVGVTPMASTQLQNFDAGSWLVARSGWSASSSSNTIWRDFFARSVAVFTFMPAAAFRWQDAASTRSPSTSTMQARQLPSAR